MNNLSAVGLSIFVLAFFSLPLLGIEQHVPEVVFPQSEYCGTITEMSGFSTLVGMYLIRVHEVNTGVETVKVPRVLKKRYSKQYNELEVGLSYTFTFQKRELVGIEIDCRF